MEATTAACVECGREFTSPKRPGKPRSVCSDECRRRRARTRQTAGGTPTTGSCAVCETEFEYLRTNQARRFCSDTCKRTNKNSVRRSGAFGPATAVCKVCGERFEYERRSQPRKFCSKKCLYRNRNLVATAKSPTIFVRCAECGTPFEYPRSRRRLRLCSDRCRQVRRAASLVRYRISHREKLRAYNRAWMRANVSRHQASVRRWRARNPAKVRAIQRARRWPRAQKREILRRYRARRRALTVVPFTLVQLKQRLSMFPGCWMCGGPWTELDHVKPLSKGGAHVLSNIRPACRSCNATKNNVWPYLPAAKPRV